VKKFEFQLEKLLSYKGQILDSEMMTLAVLNNQLSEEQERLHKLRMEREECGAECENKMLERTTPATCRMYGHYAEHLKEQILHTQRTIEGLTVQIDRQVELIKKLKMETKSLETLKTARYDEYKKEDLKAAELQIEEFVSTSKIMRKVV
jgi:flagellar export protein FliJ